MTTMTSMTMPRTVERSPPKHTEGVSHVLPMLMALAFLIAAGVVSILLSGPMH